MELFKFELKKICLFQKGLLIGGLCLAVTCLFLVLFPEMKDPRIKESSFQYMKLLNMGKRIEEIGIQIQEGDFDIYTMAKELSFEERKTLLDLIGFWRKELSLIAQTMVNGKQ